MTPKEAFATGGRNPNSGLWVRDWYGVIANFAKAHVALGQEIFTAPRLFLAIDLASHFTMHFRLVPRQLSATRAEDVIELLKETFEEYGLPRRGVTCSASSWMSSQEMLFDDDTRVHGELLQQHGLEFGPMSDADRTEVAAWVRGHGLLFTFDADGLDEAV